MYLIYAGFNYSAENGFVSVVNEFISDRSLIWDWLQEHGASLLEWLKQPQVLAVIMTWWISFSVIFILLFCVGFNPVGIGAGTMAAVFQSWAYGGFTPAGGIFATLTSLGMLGWLMPGQVCVAAVVATVAAIIVWVCGVGT